MIFLVEKKLYTEFFLNLPIYYLKVRKGKLGVTKVVCEINWIKCNFSAILRRHCCYRNRRNTLSVDST